jgi:hypothetical protein
LKANEFLKRAAGMRNGQSDRRMSDLGILFFFKSALLIMRI